MKLIKEQALKSGKIRVTIDLEPGEKLVSLKASDHVKLGYPHEDVVAAHVVLDAQKVLWCSASQEWVDV